MNEIRKYIRKRQEGKYQVGEKIGIMIAFKDEEGKIRFGWSITAKEDKFDKIKAVQIATGKAMNSREYKTHSRIKEPATYFIQRAKKYFKTDKIYYGGIEL